MIQLNPTVGVAPGTTTMQLGDCPPDEVRYYTDPPIVQTGGTAPPDGTVYDPYANFERLRGLKGLGDATPRWGLVVVTGLVMFAATLSVRRYVRR